MSCIPFVSLAKERIWCDGSGIQDTCTRCSSPVVWSSMSHSKAFSKFKYNVDTLRELFRFFDDRIDRFNAEDLPSIRLRADEAKSRMDIAAVCYPDSKNELYKEARELATTLGEFLTVKNVIDLQHRWYVVMLVTVTEAYLLDALVEAAAIDTTLVEKSEQPVAYKELALFDSIDGLAHEMRTTWARHFIDSGGPGCWIERLTRMGARGYSECLAAKLELTWGIRHLVVHQTGRINTDFSRRYPDFPKEKNGNIVVDGDRVLECTLSVIEFAGVTDR